MATRASLRVAVLVIIEDNMNEIEKLLIAKYCLFFVFLVILGIIAYVFGVV